MNNKYSQTLLAIMCGLLISGIVILYVGGTWFGPIGLLGLIPLILGGLMVQGFSWPKDAETSKVWLIRYYGQLTTTKVTGMTLLLDWLPVEIVGKVEIDMKKKDHDFKLLKPILCNDGIYIDDEKSRISVSMSPDDKDDEISADDTDSEHKTGGEKLRDFQNAGGIPGIIEQLDDMLTVWTQEIAAGKRGHTSQWMETHGNDIKKILLPKLEGRKGRTGEANNPEDDDARGFGVHFNKFQVVLLPSKEIVKARNDIQVQKDTRRAELTNTETVNLQIEERLKFYRQGKPDESGRGWIIPPTPSNLIPSLGEIRNMIVQENLMHAGKVTQVINKDGINFVNATQPPQT